MKKRIIVTAAITACLALWGAVWPQAETVGEPPASPQTPAVSAPEPIVTEVKLETEIDFPAEKEKAATPQPEPPHETTNESEPAPVEASAAPDTRPTSAPEPAPEPIPALAQVQAVTGPQSGDTLHSCDPGRRSACAFLPQGNCRPRRSE